MAYSLDTQIDLNPKVDCSYIISYAHRKINSYPEKSKWKISPDKEVYCFVNSQKFNWVEDNISWGLLQESNYLIELGVNRFKETLKFAKFIDSNKKNIWHGYPADYMRNQQDRPRISILLDWRNRGIIQKYHVTRIRRGKKCNL